MFNDFAYVFVLKAKSPTKKKQQLFGINERIRMATQFSFTSLLGFHSEDYLSFFLIKIVFITSFDHANILYAYRSPFTMFLVYVSVWNNIICFTVASYVHQWNFMFECKTLEPWLHEPYLSFFLLSYISKIRTRIRYAYLR